MKNDSRSFLVTWRFKAIQSNMIQLWGWEKRRRKKKRKRRKAIAKKCQGLNLGMTSAVSGCYLLLCLPPFQAPLFSHRAIHSVPHNIAAPILPIGEHLLMSSDTRVLCSQPAKAKL